MTVTDHQPKAIYSLADMYDRAVARAAEAAPTYPAVVEQIRDAMDRHPAGKGIQAWVPSDEYFTPDDDEHGIPFHRVIDEAVDQHGRSWVRLQVGSEE